MTEFLGNLVPWVTGACVGSILTVLFYELWPWRD